MHPAPRSPLNWISHTPMPPTPTNSMLSCGGTARAILRCLHLSIRFLSKLNRQRREPALHQKFAEILDLAAQRMEVLMVRPRPSGGGSEPVLGRVEADPWQGFALNPDLRQLIALTPSFIGVSVVRKQRASGVRCGNVTLIIRFSLLY